MKDLIVKRIYYRIDFELSSPFAVSNQSAIDITEFDDTYNPYISSYSISSAFHSFVPSLTKGFNNNIWFYDAPFFGYKIKKFKLNNKTIIGVDEGSKGSIYLQVIIHKKNKFNDNGKLVYVNAKNAEKMFNEYIRNAIDALRSETITIGGFKKHGFGHLRVLQVNEKIFDKHNVLEYLDFERKEWVNG